MKQTRLAGGTVPSSIVTPTVGEGGQPVIEVGPVARAAEVAPNAPSSILGNRK